MPTVLDWSPAVDPSELVRVIREAVAAGSPVVLPGDCGYAALVNPSGPNAVAQLNALMAPPSAPPAVLAYGADDPQGLGLRVPLAARRLMFRGWPGPLVVAIPGTPDWPSGWPAAVREKLTAAGPVRFRYPEHPLFEAVVPALELPALVVDTLRPTAEAVLDLLEDPEAVAVSVGEQPAEGKPTVVTASQAGYEITEPGTFPADEIEKLAARIVLFVCTGNTCRSPLAEGLAKKLLAERLGCRVDELPRRGFWVLSAGVAASPESAAAAEAVTVAAEYGAELGEHRSRPVNPQLLAAADEVVAMTRGHAHALVSRYRGAGPVPRLLCGDTDLDDPIGAGLDVYRQCARTIVSQLERFLPEWTGQ
jgi:protein-tyrosine phosphatase